MNKKILFWLTLLILVGCTSNIARNIETCTEGRTKLDGVCVQEEVADYVGCVRAQGARLTMGKSNSLSADAGYFAIKASAASEVSEKLERMYTASDKAMIAIIEQCNKIVGIANKPKKVAKVPSETGKQKAAPVPPVDDKKDTDDPISVSDTDHFIPLSDIFNVERSKFEKEHEYHARRLKLLKDNRFNQAVQDADQRYQAGVAYLEYYDVEKEILTVKLDWQAAWVKEFVGVQLKTSFVKISPKEAEVFWETGKKKPLFVTIGMSRKRLSFESIILVDHGKKWTIAPPRYIDHGDGTVTDFKSGLVWLKNASCFGRQNWENAIYKVANLAHGECGLSDGSKAGMWRLPTKGELEAMVDKRYKNPALSEPLISNAMGTGQWKEGDAFESVEDWYCSSSTTSNSAWYINFIQNGQSRYYPKSDHGYVWPVRDGH